MHPMKGTVGGMVVSMVITLLACSTTLRDKVDKQMVDGWELV